MVVAVEIGCDHVVMAVVGVVVMMTVGFSCDFSVMIGVVVISLQWQCLGLVVSMLCQQ